MLADYDQRGRILDGTREQMADAAYQRWLADHLSGKASLLLATTNAQAAELARRARDELAALGLVATGDLAELADGNVAGVGDLIVARQNIRIEAGEPGRRLANRDVLRIDAWDEIGRGTCRAGPARHRPRSADGRGAVVGAVRAARGLHRTARRPRLRRERARRRGPHRRHRAPGRGRDRRAGVAVCRHEPRPRAQHRLRGDRTRPRR